ncbi:glucose 1-dehydrogenase [Oscillatoria sp. FACHB-1407]|uniref:glucose 1-dehydrogenase n=1 Tax=Oscillatoria sp. FACHB-1407 TaxID=2692847 RepID=UPI001685ADED|nr:glucose 1-dehydrogenase [Oscillatoria sp. FACHB-1407]MBD2463499.1 glucose 1-dehydrogenase [Oscillatoria sp. FACHB-1407]
MKLTGKKALITGGNSGIGFATARLFIQEGAEVAITGRDQTTLDAAVEELGANAVAYRADVTDSTTRTDLFDKLGHQFGELDIVFANAGISARTPVGSTDEAIFENIIRVNLTGAFLTVQAALPLLKDGSSIILNGSIIASQGRIGSQGRGGHAAYAASKAGIVGMARSLASDLAPRRIRVNVVAPGATKTPIWSRNPLPPEQADEMAKRLAATIPLGRWGEADEIAKAVLFLASDDASYVNSVELFVDGGVVGSPYGGAVFQSA